MKLRSMIDEWKPTNSSAIADLASYMIFSQLDLPSTVYVEDNATGQTLYMRSSDGHESVRFPKSQEEGLSEIPSESPYPYGSTRAREGKHKRYDGGERPGSRQDRQGSVYFSESEEEESSDDLSKAPYHHDSHDSTRARHGKHKRHEGAERAERPDSRRDRRELQPMRGGSNAVHEKVYPEPHSWKELKDEILGCRVDQVRQLSRHHSRYKVNGRLKTLTGQSRLCEASINNPSKEIFQLAHCS